MTKISMPINDAVEYSGVSRTKIYELFKVGALTPLKCGRRTLILREELDAFIRSLPVAA